MKKDERINNDLQNTETQRVNNTDITKNRM